MVTRPVSQSILDLVMTTNANIVSDLTTVSGISDHDIVVFSLSLSPKIHRKPRRKIWQYNKADMSTFSAYLEEAFISFSADSPSRSVSGNWDAFKSIVIKGMNEFVPSKLSRTKTSLPWMTRDIKRQTRKKDKFHTLAKNTKKSRVQNAYKQQCSKVNKLIRQSHSRYIIII